MSAYDPPGTSEGSLDPLGLYQIADQLGVQLVPAVRERMQRIRFLTAMAVGALVTEDLEELPEHRDASPYLVWEWLFVESVIRSVDDTSSDWGIPGTLVAHRALDQQGYLDARSYLKTPRIFGFHGVYKRLAHHLGIVDVHLRPGLHTEGLVNAWAKGKGLGGIEGAKPMMDRWGEAVRRSMNQKPPHTRPGWSNAAWQELAHSFLPSQCKTPERRFLRELLHSAGESRLGALPVIWELHAEFSDDEFQEHLLHHRLAARAAEYRPLLDAIRTYEAFSRRLQNAFDILKAKAVTNDAKGYVVTDIAKDSEFQQCTRDLHKHFELAHQQLGEVAGLQLSLQNLFDDRFRAFADPMDTGTVALNLCAHHESIQREKSDTGKRPWFDRLGPSRIYIRHGYRKPRPENPLDLYVHDYRGRPIRRFLKDLS